MLLLILIPLTGFRTISSDLFLTLLAFYGLYCSFKFNKEIFVSLKNLFFIYNIFFNFITIKYFI